MQPPVNQYPKDSKPDPSFLSQARLHLSVFRAKHLGLPFDTDGLPEHLSLKNNQEKHICVWRNSLYLAGF
jgi:hypothetical protein